MNPTEEEEEGEIMEDAKEAQLANVMQERQTMETRQEVERIERMCKVKKVLDDHIAAKIGRNLQAKHVNGPLGKDKEKDSRISSSSEIHSPLTSPSIPPPPPLHWEADRTQPTVSGRREKLVRRISRKDESKRNWVVGKRTLGVTGASFEEDQKKELKDIKGLHVVRNRLANKRKASYLANRMFNHRVNNSTTKTSILVSGSEPDPEEIIKVMRLKNRFVIEKFLQTQSQNRRVLERLNSRQATAISAIEVGKADKRRRRSDSSVHEAMILEETEEREKEEERIGAKRIRKRASLSSFSGLSTRLHVAEKHTNGASEGSTLRKVWDRGVQSFRSKKESASSAVKRGLSKFKKEKGGSRRRLRKQKMKKEEMKDYLDKDDVVSRSSGTDEVDEATPTQSGALLETLLEEILPPRSSDVGERGSSFKSQQSNPSNGWLPPDKKPLPTASVYDDHDEVIDKATPISSQLFTQVMSGDTPTPLYSHVTAPAPPISLQAPPSTLSSHHATPLSPKQDNNPPPFQAHGIPTSLSLAPPSTSESSADDLSGDIVGPSPCADMTFEAVTPAGYQGDSESLDLSQEWTGFPTLSLANSQLPFCSADFDLDPPSKRAKIAEADEVDTVISKPQAVAKSGGVDAPTKFTIATEPYPLREPVDKPFVVSGPAHGESLNSFEVEEEEEKRETVKEKEPASRRTPSPSKLQPSRKSASLESQTGSDQVSTATSPRQLKRHFSSPHFISTGDTEARGMKPRPRVSRHHGYYTPVQIDEEFNPFNYEFEVGRPPDCRIAADSASTELHRSAGTNRRSAGISPRPRLSPLSPEVKQKKEVIPDHVHNDPDFQKYVGTLDHEPTYEDYLSFVVFRRLVHIGDNVEKRYKDKINFALDNIFMDIMKKAFTFEKFSAVANRLLLEAKRFHDGVFMIPLLARRLKELVTPQMDLDIEEYTEMFMENFVTKNIMAMGGWESIVECFDDIEVHDEHPSYYGYQATDYGEGPYHEHSTSNYDHLYDGSRVDPFSPTATSHHGFEHEYGMDDFGARTYFLDTYEEDGLQLMPEDTQQRRENLFLYYLSMHHSFLLEPGYLRRVNSVDVLFQDTAKLSQTDDCDGHSESGETLPSSHERKRKRSSQVSLARSLSLDSLASPGLGSGAFCITPTASGMFLSRRISRSASKGEADPVESPKKRTFPSHSPIHEHVDPPISPDNLLQDPSILIVSNGDSNTPHLRHRPPPLPHISSPQVSFSPSPHSPYREQSSGDNYDNLYDSGPSRSSTGRRSRSSTGSKTDSISRGGSGSTRPQATNGNATKPDVDVGGAKTWLIPAAAVVAVSAVALIAGFFYMRKRT